MKQFYYIDENNEEQIDLIHLFEHAFDYSIATDEIIQALKILQKHIQINKI
tara:strand:+ start:43 stop:195 length:153 start_codon:yes stop_codon:yes gene_type:complete